jgi:cytoskeletal protein CcmA (bactofilin family)
MGIINRSSADGSPGAGTTLVAAGSKLVGDLTLSDNLHIDGSIEGTVRSRAEVAIGQEGRIEGDITAERVIVSGKVEGTISAKRLEIISGGRVDGDVTAAELVIESGALFNGNSRIRDAETAPSAEQESRGKAAGRQKRSPAKTEAAGAG